MNRRGVYEIESKYHVRQNPIEKHKTVKPLTEVVPMFVDRHPTFKNTAISGSAVVVKYGWNQTTSACTPNQEQNGSCTAYDGHPQYPQ